MPIGTTSNMEWLVGSGSGSVEYTGGTGIDVDNTNHVISADLTEVQAKLTAGSNVTIQNNVISAQDTRYSAGTGLELSGTQFAVTNPMPAPAIASNTVLTTDGAGGCGWLPSGRVLAHDSNTNMSLTLTPDDISNGFADYTLSNIIVSQYWALFASIVQVRPMSSNTTISSIQFGFKNHLGDFYDLITFGSADIETARYKQVNAWDVDHVPPWTYLVCRWTLADGHTFVAGDTLSTHFTLVCANGSIID